MAIEEQMDMFNDGGLMDEGGTVDPVSGNEVPVGSTQKEVRDDIPAQLSEGEFVFPADVVRYIGLGNLMRMRQEAKMGLRVMDEMGQMGNSEEATLPDDIPFDINDLDIEEQKEDNSELEMQVGGVVPPVPTTPPLQAAPVPTMPQTPVPEFSQFTGGGFGQYDELRQYSNEMGQIIQVPFKNGQPVSPIPEGYTAGVKQPEVTPQSTTAETATVLQQGEMGGAEERRLAEEERMFGKGGGRLSLAGETYGVSFETPESILGGVKDVAASLALGKPVPAGSTVTLKRGDSEYKITGEAYNELKSVLDEKGYNSEEGAAKFNELVLDKPAAKQKALATQARRRKEEARGKGNLEEARKQEQIEQERLKQLSNINIDRLYGNAEDRGADQQRAAERQRDTDAFTREAVRDVGSRTKQGRGFAKGGYATKKQSGLASKK